MIIIRKKSIRSVERYLAVLSEGDKFYVAAEINEDTVGKIKEIGFGETLSEGDTVLPKIIGTRTRFNAKGLEYGDSSQPKERRTISGTRKTTDWHGGTHYGFQSRSIKAYPKVYIDAPEEYLTIGLKKERQYVLSQKLTYSESNKERIIHVINIFLEIFGYCFILNDKIEEISIPRIKKLNWAILPEGESPWERIKRTVDTVTKEYNSSDKKDIQRRLKLITDYNPDFIAVGMGGFTGYFVLGYKEKNKYVLESLDFGNATYILNNNWEEISQLTKKNILEQSLEEKRVIHNRLWVSNIKKILEEK